MWLDMDGYSVESLQKDPKFPNTPDIRALAHCFKEPPDLGESYGSRMYAWFAPPETGNYQFLICKYSLSLLLFQREVLEEPPPTAVLLWRSGNYWYDMS